MTRGRRPPDAARLAAYDVARAVSSRDAYANLVLPAQLRRRGLDARDAAFATELCYGTLRWLGTYDAVLAACVDRPLDRLDPPLRDVLRLGVHQLLGMRVPAHAAVAATVDLARAEIGAGPAGLVNAVLRRVADRDRDEWFRALAPSRDTDPVGHLAFVHGHPRWVVSAFLDVLGGDLTETAAALAADNVAAPVHLAARPGRIDPAAVLAAAGPDATPGRFSPYAVHLPRGDPGALPAVRDGRVGVQDEGSQLAALAVAAARLDGADRRWLDLCAGPGGKAALLAGLAGGRGAVLLAVEVAAHRARLVRSAVTRPALVVQADALVPPWPAATFDRVLVDAPCTGLGALRRRPEARWRREPADVARLAPLQRGLLRSGLRAVRPGGVVAYVTCSPHVAETRVVVADVLREVPHVTRLDARAVLPGVPELGGGPDVQLWPHRHGTDAMFVALLRRDA
ncbi:MAG TPA: transcription antitermination factor NusB [Mycobacteriales bacterium]|nr:transcription antitermination factor NusB [Mycobacteriales bacterium]